MLQPIVSWVLFWMHRTKWYIFFSWFLKFDILNLMWLASSALIHWRKTSLSISLMNHADSVVVARTSFHRTLFSLANMQMGILSQHCTLWLPQMDIRNVWKDRHWTAHARHLWGQPAGPWIKPYLYISKSEASISRKSVVSLIGVDWHLFFTFCFP